MTRSRQDAFTLIELLVVIAIVCVLIGMLMPAMGAAWHAVDATRCQTNLAVLYKANSVWAAERLSGQGPAPATNVSSSDEWSGKVSVYLEGRMSELRCPLGNSQADTSALNFGGSEAALSLADVTIGALDGTGRLLYEIPLSDSPYWTFYQTWDLGGGKKHLGAQIDSYWPTSQITVPNMKVRPMVRPDTQQPLGPKDYYTDEDFQFIATLSPSGALIALALGDCDGNGDSVYTDMRVCGKPLWNGQRFQSPFGAGHFGESIDLGAGMPHSGTWTMYSGAGGILSGLCYGISRGCYNDRLGNDMKAADPKLFFLLDYPRAVADYTTLNDSKSVPDAGNWPKIFIWPTPPQNWTAPTQLDGWTWANVQALRHEGRANVLFCDGHIESLGPDQLSATSPLWWK